MSHHPPSLTSAHPATTVHRPLASPSSKGRPLHAACVRSSTTIPTELPHPGCPGAKAYKDSTPSILSIPSSSSPFPGQPHHRGPLFLAAAAHHHRPISLATLLPTQVSGNRLALVSLKELTPSLPVHRNRRSPVPRHRQIFPFGGLCH
jgi:hypothetical protein